MVDTEALKKNFQEQLATAEKQIRELKENLVKTEEYRTKLLGGIETLELLEGKPEESEEVTEEAAE
jgi:hypothetical protein